MTDKSDKKLHRLYMSIPEDVYYDFKDTIQWGLRNAMIVEILKILTKAVQKDGMMIVGAVLSGKYKLVVDKNEESHAETGRLEEVASSDGPRGTETENQGNP